jgi:hypothetical protein
MADVDGAVDQKGKEGAAGDSEGREQKREERCITTEKRGRISRCVFLCIIKI